MGLGSNAKQTNTETSCHNNTAEFKTFTPKRWNHSENESFQGTTATTTLAFRSDGAFEEGGVEEVGGGHNQGAPDHPPTPTIRLTSGYNVEAGHWCWGVAAGLCVWVDWGIVCTTSRVAGKRCCCYCCRWWMWRCRLVCVRQWWGWMDSGSGGLKSSTSLVSSSLCSWLRGPPSNRQTDRQLGVGGNQRQARKVEVEHKPDMVEEKQNIYLYIYCFSLLLCTVHVGLNSCNHNKIPLLTSTFEAKQWNTTTASCVKRQEGNFIPPTKRKLNSRSVAQCFHI